MDVLDLFYTICILAGSFLLSWNIIPVIKNISLQKALIDSPELDERKNHKEAIPNLGGIAIVASLLIIMPFSGEATSTWFPSVTAGLVILFLSGIKDDILTISPLKKLLFQCIAVLILMIVGGFHLSHLGGLFGLDTIPFWIGALLTFSTMLITINAFNLIDGIDGLAAGIGIMASLFFGWWFWEAGDLSKAMLAIVLAGSLLGFLWYNFQPASIYMGDTGSQLVGYLLGFLSLSAIELSATTEQTIPFKHSLPVLVIAVMIVPIYDTLRVFILRLWKGRSPLQADRLHVHHQLTDMGFSHRFTCVILYSYTGLFTLMVILIEGVDVNLQLAIVAVTTVLLFPTRDLKRGLVKKVGYQIPEPDNIKKWERFILGNPEKPEKRNGKDYPKEKVIETEEEENQVHH